MRRSGKLLEAIEALSAKADAVILAGAVLAGLDRVLQPQARGATCFTS